MKTARKLIAQGKSCGIDMGRYSPEAICSYYLREEKFTDEQAVSRLKVFMDGGCQSLRAAVDGSRI